MLYYIPMPTAKKQTQQFAQNYANLEKIVAWFEKGSFDLEEGIERFKEGAKLVADLKQQLAHMENTITELTKKTN